MRKQFIILKWRINKIIHFFKMFNKSYREKDMRFVAYITEEKKEVEELLKSFE